MNTKSKRTLRRMLAVAVTATVLGHSSHATWAQDGGQLQENPAPGQLSTGDLNNARPAVQGDAAPAARAAGDPQRIGTESDRNRLDGTRESVESRLQDRVGERGSEQDLRSSAQSQQADAQPRQADAQPRQADAQPQQADAQPQQADGQPQQADGQPRQADGQPRQAYGQDAQRYDGSDWQDQRRYDDDGIIVPSPDDRSGQQGREAASRMSQRPVYNRDAQGRFYFDDAIGQRFVFTDQGQWVHQGGDPRSESKLRLGVTLSESSRGLQVSDVVRGSGAERAGVQRGDIILRANGESVRTAQEFVQRIENLDQDQVELTVIRDGREAELTANLAASDAYQVARPVMGGEGRRNGYDDGLSQRIESLEREIDQLKSRLDRTLEAEIGQRSETGLSQGSEAGLSQGSDAGLSQGPEASLFDELEATESESGAAASDRSLNNNDR